ncbi:MAG TPA: LysM peptidoglycan-binding domain-containing protein [Polyangiaceae bacterium]|nr:LysM peptidoglycan-binding domain-containing protein [Polyangiaceae bacterium]
MRARLVCWGSLALLCRGALASGQPLPPAPDLWSWDSGPRVVLASEPARSTVAVCSTFPAGWAHDAENGGRLAHAVAAALHRATEPEGMRLGSIVREYRVTNEWAQFCSAAAADQLPALLQAEAGRTGGRALDVDRFAAGLRSLSLGAEESVAEHLHRRTRWLANPAAQVASSAFVVQGLDAANARRFATEHYGLGKAVVSLAGGFEVATAKALIFQHYAGLSSGKRGAPPADAVPPPRQTSPRFLALPERDALGAWIARAAIVPGPGAAEHAALELAAERLAGAGGLVSYSWGRGRAAQFGYTFDNHADWALMGIWIQGVANSTARELAKAIEVAVARLRSTPMTATELERARRALAGRLARELESSLGQARWFGRRELAGSPLDPRAELARHASVDGGAVRRAVAAHLPESRRIVVELLSREALAASEEPPARFHAVSTGESLHQIAEQHRTSVAEIARLNGIDRRHLLRRGQQLRVPPTPSAVPRSHLVKQGDTLSSIGQRYRVSAEALERLNKLRKGAVINVGQRLLLP